MFHNSSSLTTLFCFLLRILKNFLGSNTYSGINPPSLQALNEMNAISRTLKKGNDQFTSLNPSSTRLSFEIIKTNRDSSRGVEDECTTDYTKNSQTWTDSCRCIRLHAGRKTTPVA